MGISSFRFSWFPKLHPKGINLWEFGNVHGQISSEVKRTKPSCTCGKRLEELMEWFKAEANENSKPKKTQIASDCSSGFGINSGDHEIRRVIFHDTANFEATPCPTGSRRISASALLEESVDSSRLLQIYVSAQHSASTLLHLPSLAFISCRDRCFSNASGGPTSGATSVWVQSLPAARLETRSVVVGKLQHAMNAPWEHLDTLPVAQNNHDASLSFVRLHFHLVKERLRVSWIIAVVL